MKSDTVFVDEEDRLMDADDANERDLLSELVSIEERDMD